MRAIGIFIFLIISFKVNGQNNNEEIKLSKYRPELGISYLYGFDMNTVNGNAILTSAAIRTTKNSFQIGALWWLDHYKSENTFRGMLGSYKYYPSGNNGKINFSFVGDLIYSYEKNQWAKFIQYDNAHFYHIDYKGKWNSLQTLVGYGVNIKLYKSLFFTNSMTIGLEFYNYSSTTNIEEAPQLSTNYKSGSIFKDSRKNGMMRIGLSYLLK